MSTRERANASYRDRTIVFDFDGTLSLGPGPVLAYARAVASQLSISDGDDFVDTVRATLDIDPSGRAAESDAIDGYDLVRLTAADYGIASESLGAAYLASRAQLGTSFAPVLAPDGITAFLALARTSANLVLATNAPDIRIDIALDVLGIGGLFDAVHTSLSKPAGLAAVLDEWMPRGELLSIGDVWANDLAPAHARGAFTALVGSTRTEGADVTPTFQAEHLPDLYPVIEDWMNGLPSSPHIITTERHSS